jgi:hypothetical protein
MDCSLFSWNATVLRSHTCLVVSKAGYTFSHLTLPYDFRRVAVEDVCSSLLVIHVIAGPGLVGVEVHLAPGVLFDNAEGLFDCSQRLAQPFPTGEVTAGLPDVDGPAFAF